MNKDEGNFTQNDPAIRSERQSRREEQRKQKKIDSLKKYLEENLHDTPPF